MTGIEQPYLFYRCVYPDMFTSEECNQIIAMTQSTHLTYEQPGADYYVHANVTDLARDTHISASPQRKYLRQIPETEWVLTRLSHILQQANAAYYQFELEGLIGVHICQYRDGALVDWHVDCGHQKISNRKLTISVFLSDPKDYTGGEFRWFPEFPPLRQEKGTVVVFPTYLMHQVAPVNQGCRYSLIAWAYGPPFR